MYRVVIRFTFRKDNLRRPFEVTFSVNPDELDERIQAYCGELERQGWLLVDQETVSLDPIN